MSTRFTKESHQVLAAAQAAANDLGHPQLLPEHLLIGLFAAEGSAPATVLLAHGLTAHTASARTAALLPQGTVLAAASAFSDDLRKVLAAASRVSLERSGSDIDITTLAQALFAAQLPGVDQILAPAKVTSAALLRELTPQPDPADLDPDADEPLPQRRGAYPAAALTGMAPASPAAAGKALATFTRDLTAAAANGELDPVIGRDRELERVSIILTRRSKNNPVLIGDPGVGKTAIVEGLAHQIANGTAPQALLGKRVLTLDLAGMVAGSRFRGDFEERVKAVIDEAHTSGDVLLFLDEIHQLTGTGSSSTSSGLDAAHMLKEALARGGITLIGATTTEEYRTIEKDAALERRFQPVRVEEPDPATTAAILDRLAPVYADHHGVRYTPAAITAAATLADRYLRDRQNPDKAIDVLDEAGARAAMAAGKAAAQDRAPHTTVDADQVATVVSAIAGVPVTTLTADETAHLRDLAARLSSRVIGQDPAVDVVARSVRRRRVGMDSGARPASFLFAGPTGVGKSELAKALADDLFGPGHDPSGRGRLIQFDMSEFAEKHTVARLIGAPPGYTGHEGGGQLTEAVRRNPYSVLLLDEVEKAHPDVFDVLLQILEDGRLTDGQGRVVDFRHTVVILTSNLGARDAAKAALGFGPGADTRSARDVVLRAVKDAFRPEFLNRLDDVVVFDRLGRTQLEQIVDGMLTPLRERLAERDITIELRPAALERVLREGYDPTMGARPLRRAITRLLADPLSDALIIGDIVAGDHVVVDAAGDVLTVAALVPQPLVAEPA